MAELERIPLARSDKISLFRSWTADGRTRLLRTASVSDTVDCQRLHHGADISRRICNEVDNMPEPSRVFDEETVTYETIVPGESLLLSELYASSRKLPDLTIMRIMRNVVSELSRGFHALGMLHNDIRLESILLLNSNDFSLCITSLEYSSLESPLKASSTCPIPSSSVLTAAPECSGRLPYLVDQRSDLYSLGVAFFQLFSGINPFSGNNVSEILHGHIAKEPADFPPGVPRKIQELILKLMQKDPARRYLSADSLLADIDLLVEAIESKKSLRNIVVGRLDELCRPRIEHATFERHTEFAELDGMLQMVRKDHKTRRVLIRGASGTGKSFLVDRYLGRMIPSSSMKASYKYNQVSSSHSGGLELIKSLTSELLRQTVSLPRQKSRQYEKDLANRLSEDLVLLAEISPELKSFLGSYYPILRKSSLAYEVTPASREARINSALVRFLQLFAKPDDPCILFIDDLQWATQSDTDIFEALLTDTKNILLIFTYRCADSSHDPSENIFGLDHYDLLITLEELQDSEAYEMLSVSLKRGGPDVHSLASVICSKTAHNLFFFNQFLKSLFDLGHLYFDFDSERWDFQIDDILVVQPATDILQFILQRLAKCDESTRKVLMVCACLARPRIDPTHVLDLCDLAVIELNTELNTLCSMGLLMKIDLDASFPDHSTAYQFTHDRIQQSSLHLIPEEKRAARLFEYGLKLLPACKLDMHSSPPAHLVFEICDLLIGGLAIGMGSPSSAIALLSLFVLAAELSNHPESRLSYLALASDIQQKFLEGQLNLKLQESLLDAHIAIGHRTEALQLVCNLQHLITDTATQIRLIQKEAKIHWLDMRDSDVRRLGEKGLRLAGFDVDFSAEVSVVMKDVIDYMSRMPQSVAGIVAYCNHFIMEDEVLLASQSLLVTIMPSIFFVSANHLIALILTLGVATVFEKGISTDGCYLLTFFGLTMCDICSPGYDYAKAKALADLALMLSDKIRLQAKSRQEADILATMYVLQGGVNTWTVNDRDYLTKIYMDANLHTTRAFNAEYSAYSNTNAIGFFGFFRGHSLRDLHHKLGPQTCLTLILRGDRATQLFALPTFQTFHILLNAKSLAEFSCISGQYVTDEAEVEMELFKGGTPAMHRACFLRCKALLALLSNDLAECGRQLSRLFEILSAIQGTPDWGFACIMRAFIMTDLEEPFYTDFREHLGVWSVQCCTDLQAVHVFFTAEDEFRVNGELNEGTLALYDESILCMLKCKNYLFAGLFAERANSRMRTAFGEIAGHGYARLARKAFEQYGCPAKASSFQQLYPEAFDLHLDRPRLNRSGDSSDTTSTTTVMNGNLDLLRRYSNHQDTRARNTSDAANTLLKGLGSNMEDLSEETDMSRSQDVSKIDLSTVVEITHLLNQKSSSVAIVEALLLHLIRIAGASLGLVALRNDTALAVAAMADQDGVRSFAEHSPSASIESAHWPSAMSATLRLAVQFGKAVHDRALLSQRTAESFLAVPLIYQGSTLGAVYLENKNIAGLYSDETKNDLIQVLVAQVAAQLARNKVIYDLEQNKKQLIEAKSIVEDALKMKDRFLSTMSHELRTPFNSVLGFSSLMLETSLDAEQYRYAESIQTSSRNLLAIINDILDFSQIEQGALKLRPSVFGLRELIRLTIESVSPALLSRGLEIIHLEDPISTGNLCFGDQGRIRQCCLNLLSNAIKFSCDSVVILRTKLEYMVDPTYVLLTLSVTDRGKGIAAQDIGKLFEHFSQLDDTTTRAQEGTGMGLAISLGITRLFKGDLTVTSELGRGSTFTATFQIKQANADDQPNPSRRIYAREVYVLVLDRIEARAEAMVYHLAALGLKGISTTSVGPLKADFRISAVFVTDSSNYPAYKSRIQSFTASRKIPVFETRLFSADHDVDDSVIVINVPINRELLSRTIQKHLFLTPDPVDPEPEKALFREIPPLKSAELPVNDLSVKFEILTVDDNKINLKVAQGFLKREGQNTDIAIDGFDALERVKEKSYDLIFMDIQMPRMDGIECTRHIRRLYKSDYFARHTPYIVALTANAIVGDRERYLANGMDDYLSKPLDKLSLRDLLFRVTEMVFARRNIKPTG